MQIASLKKSLELGGTSPAAQMVTPIVEELAAEGAIQGQLRGGATTWVPAIYLRRQQESIVSFYKQNSYVGCAHILSFAVLVYVVEQDA